MIYNEIAYFAPYGANHVGIFDLKSEHFGLIFLCVVSFGGDWVGVLLPVLWELFCMQSQSHVCNFLFGLLDW